MAGRFRYFTPTRAAIIIGASDGVSISPLARRSGHACADCRRRRHRRWGIITSMHEEHGPPRFGRDRAALYAEISDRQRRPRYRHPSRQPSQIIMYFADAPDGDGQSSNQ